ncbi:NAM-associated domain-containing protein [Heracleum sosnowskyi]|uniref:NAM-associated domain-containing protein n=1 Tax=Heracleum sosnowskyi TaxID=360622 RepID=A0AAD8J9M4_9APIA|nr:NAM-associated domain-containing protein [Heracleum sosnowskyi]
MSIQHLLQMYTFHKIMVVKEVIVNPSHVYFSQDRGGERSEEVIVNPSQELKRPVGRKDAKEIEKKRKRSKNEHDDGGAAILEQLRADHLESKKQRNEHLKEMIQLAKERTEREKERDEREKKIEAHEQSEGDAKIMAVDTSVMGDIEREYFNSRKKEIIERIRTRSTTT